ncbi:4-hydroxy-3-methylbut-2-en-1-yl diphosphate synthase [Lishizhenia tianjinensis]|uniref:4-hydroxy-3-methylbut-2-en-1-yl diphosphate synthase (flavodoxin) n=1 Tax=Lishizhenia tianjinensis TaxID=477690 RepID=A0A1I7BAX3_9FLAO|nr:(E)-4-hydroxy-3-methylbut-2-enyl-diphosphate synthase [Lishizhenia tianjinensis]SFT84375.1 4-hydroxy-3-methylbut-2-en-1-yl diphosphate synthase [Lishizhenia tianjinensis]
MKYCNSLTKRTRFKTREVKIGNLTLGGGAPIRIQSMTTADTMDTKGSVEESIRMIDAGCELVRLTAPSKKEAENLGVIKAELLAKGYDTPLVADIHFTPNAAEIAATKIEKVRVNPGNYADKKKFEEIEYNDESYQAELERIEKKFTPLVLLCKKEGTAMRIGTNHGSLSDRILSRYGDTPEGMVESAMEFLRICRKHDFHEIVISMKASNTLVMVQAYRMLVAVMMEEGMNYPLHLGVTEAGDGEDGRIKSAVGIGALLADGLGDTIRVSLTEAPEYEIPVAQKLVNIYEEENNVDISAIDSLKYDPFHYTRRDSIELHNIGHKHVPVVIGDLHTTENIKPSHLFGFGHNYAVELDKWNQKDLAADYIYVGQQQVDFETPGYLGIICDLDNYTKNYANKDHFFPLHTSPETLSQTNAKINFLKINVNQYDFKLIDLPKNTVLIAETEGSFTQSFRKFFNTLVIENIETPVILNLKLNTSDLEHYQLESGAMAGSVLIDGFGDGLFIQNEQHLPHLATTSTAFGILQATRTRISRTEYISCPSCGRTLFDLQETTAKIRKSTSHLKGVKIGIMGCIVNGPGEMADADYGYVGTGPGKINLYKEKEVIKRNVPEEEAVDALIDLIKSYGDWNEVSSQ